MNPRVLIALVLLCVFALGATVLAATQGDEVDGERLSAGGGFAGALMPKGVRAPDFALEDQDGERSRCARCAAGL